MDLGVKDLCAGNHPLSAVIHGWKKFGISDNDILLGCQGAGIIDNANNYKVENFLIVRKIDISQQQGSSLSSNGGFASISTSMTNTPTQYMGVAVDPVPSSRYRSNPCKSLNITFYEILIVVSSGLLVGIFASLLKEIANNLKNIVLTSNQRLLNNQDFSLQIDSQNFAKLAELLKVFSLYHSGNLNKLETQKILKKSFNFTDQQISILLEK